MSGYNSLHKRRAYAVRLKDKRFFSLKTTKRVVFAFFTRVCFPSDRGRVVGGLPDVVTIMEQKVRRRAVTAC